MSKRGFADFVAMNRRAFFGAAAAGLGAIGLAGPCAAARARSIAVEPDLTDATANAPGYSDQPRRKRPPAAVAVEPVDPAFGS